mmetsp:Transcript_65099/g.121318  ORF Transcript_65099/g.121318 Transcript_65099/m.121318 type:complete len:277 (-) Transcript_65099:62-892(-)
MEDALGAMTPAAAVDEEIEYTLLNKREVMVYQVPPAASAAGHKAEDWKQCIWRGKMRVAGKGKDMSIKLLDAASEALFAQCSIPNGEHEKFVERVVDSSRYFVLKITNGARHAFIGLGFEERNDAFDFNCCLADFKSRFVDRENEVDAAPKVQAPPKDLSLKEGQKIKISIAGLEGKKRRETSDAPPAGGGTGLFGLAPPPSSGSSQSRRTVAQQANSILEAPPAAPNPTYSAPAQPPSASPAPSVTEQVDPFAALSGMKPAAPEKGKVDEFDIFK